jgi:beta-lactamase regulating signal transducer with metallopeptidase domain
MNLEWIENIGTVLLKNSAAGGILVCLILAARSFLHHRVSQKWLFWLWVLAILRFLTPWTPPSPFSVLNLLRTETMSSVSADEDTEESYHAIAVPAQQNTTVLKTIPNEHTLFLKPLEKSSSFGIKPIAVLALVWGLGAGSLATFITLRSIYFWIILRKEKPIIQQEVLELLEECKSRMGIHTLLCIVQTSRIQTPALMGFIRPRLIIPAGLVESVSKTELRHIFLHELAHLKRQDIFVSWAMALTQILHWFNPLAWVAAWQMVRDRELACDAMVLSVLDRKQNQAYGGTLLNLMERMNNRPLGIGLSGILENKSFVRRRIEMIASYKPGKLLLGPVFLAIIAVVFVAVTSAEKASVGPADANQPSAAVESSSKPLPRKSAAMKELANDDSKSAGSESIAGGAHYIKFQNEGSAEIIGIKVYGSRYGTPQPPKENFTIIVGNQNNEPIETMEFPYSTFKRGNPTWYTIKMPKPVAVGQEFYVCVDFFPEKTKGIYVHHDKEASGHSFIGSTTDNVEMKPFDRGDWMIRAMVRSASDGQSSAVPAASAESTNQFQILIDAAAEGSTVEIPAGTYTEPITISKALTVRGAEREKCIIKVIADKPAVTVNTKGKKVTVENMTIQWKLATSDKCDAPFALGVKDAQAEIKNCVFRPMGNPQQSPVGINASGFSEMTVSDCDFTGFDYVVCFGAGTKGSMQDCCIRDCGHQGVILYSGAEATVARNIITGSKFHAVRSTGGKLTLRDNLIINNANRGVYLGNKSASGVIENNLLINNASGIDGISASSFKISNNVILKSSYAAISAIPQARLAVGGNILMDNVRGIVIHQKEGQADPIQFKLEKNIFWENKTDLENWEQSGIEKSQPVFTDAAGGDYTITDEKMKGQGLSDTRVIKTLWGKYQKSK